MSCLSLGQVLWNVWPSNRCFEIARGTAQLVKECWNYFYQSWKFNPQVKILLATYPESVVHCLPCRQELVLSHQTKLQPDLIRVSSKKSWCDQHVLPRTKCKVWSRNSSRRIVLVSWAVGLICLCWRMSMRICVTIYCVKLFHVQWATMHPVVRISNYSVTIFHLGSNHLKFKVSIAKARPRTWSSWSI